MNPKITAARARRDDAYSAFERANEAIQNAQPGDDLAALNATFDEAEAVHQRAVRFCEQAEATFAARGSLKVDPGAGSPHVEDNGTGNGRFSRGGARVTSEPLTYERGNGRSFFRDLLQASRGDHEASQRLAAHENEARVEFALGSASDAAGGALVAPLYLNEELGEVPRAAAPTVMAIGARDTPDTDVINIPKVSTGTTVDVQTADNAALSNTDPAFSMAQAAVKTIGGYNDVSRQIVDRGVPDTDSVILGDLVRAYYSKFDADVLNSATANYTGLLQVAGTTTVTYTDATPTLPELYPKIASAMNAVATGLFLPADTIVMHPRRWAFIMASLDAQNRPLVVPVASGRHNSLGTMDTVAAEGIVGTLLGLPVYLDANMPTTLGAGSNEDAIIVFRRSESFVWETQGGPFIERFDGPGSSTLTVRFRAFSYVGQLHDRRPLSIAKITGTGLIEPVL